MKIQYNIKPVHEQPVTIGSKVVIKKEWYGRMDNWGIYVPKRKFFVVVEDEDGKSDGLDGFTYPLYEVYDNVPSNIKGIMIKEPNGCQYCCTLDAVEKYVEPQKVVKPKVEKTYQTNLNIKVSRKQYPNFVKDMEKLKLKYENKV